MKPILVHVHIYYPEMWKELKSYLENLAAYPYDLHVTFVENHQNIIEDIKLFKPNAKVEIVENRGFDVGPFIHVLNQVNLDDYSYLIKLHTKRDMFVGCTYNHSINVSGNRWRKYLLSFLEKKNIQKCIDNLEYNKKLGMSGNFRLIVKKETFDEKALKECEKYLSKVDLKIKKFAYIGGTMFIARAQLFNVIKNMNLELSDFDIPTRKVVTTKAHIFERLLGLIIEAQDCQVKDVYTSKLKQFLVRFYAPIGLFLYRKKVTSKGKVIIKICKIPVCFYFKGKSVV